MGILNTFRALSRPARRHLLAALGAFGYDISRKDEHGRVIFSADGEDAIALSWLCEHFGVAKQDIRYLDIGAGDPCRLSNTFLMYRWGARGVLVEPDPDQVRKLRRKRPRDLVVQAGIAFDERRSAMLCRYQDRLFNSFDSGRDRTWSGAMVDSVEVELVPINDVMAVHFAGTAPHFLSVDAEGFDHAILSSVDFARFRPLIVCVELCRPLADFAALVAPWKYELIVHTTHNAMFALKRN